MQKMVDLRGYRAGGRKIAIPDKWDGAHYMARLVGCYRTLAYLPNGRNAKPKDYSTCWPEYRHEWGDQLAQAGGDQSDQRRDQNKKNYVRPRPTREEITRMETLFDALYAFRTHYPAECNMMLAWAYARYRNTSVDIVAHRFKVSKSTLFRKLRALASLCSDLLNVHNFATY